MLQVHIVCLIGTVRDYCLYAGDFPVGLYSGRILGDLASWGSLAFIEKLI